MSDNLGRLEALRSAASSTTANACLVSAPTDISALGVVETMHSLSVKTRQINLETSANNYSRLFRGYLWTDDE